MVRIRRMPFLAAATSAGARSFMSNRKSETSCILPVALSSFLPECSFQHDFPAKLFTSSPVSKGSDGPPATALATAPAAAPAAEASMLEKLMPARRYRTGPPRASCRGRRTAPCLGGKVSGHKILLRHYT